MSVKLISGSLSAIFGGFMRKTRQTARQHALRFAVLSGICSETSVSEQLY
jgi:hypothetical protein